MIILSILNVLTLLHLVIEDSHWFIDWLWSLIGNDASKVLMFDNWMFSKNFCFIHFDHSTCYFFPIGSSTDVIDDRWGLCKRNTSFDWNNKLDAVKVHIFIGIFANNGFLYKNSPYIMNALWRAELFISQNLWCS